MRLIDADELLYRLREIVREMQYEDVDDEETAISAYLDSILRVKCMPTIYPDGDHIRHGHWMNANYGRYYICSVCTRIYETYGFDYCPNCGAKMDGPMEVKNDDSKTTPCRSYPRPC